MFKTFKEQYEMCKLKSIMKCPRTSHKPIEILQRSTLAQLFANQSCVVVIGGIRYWDFTLFGYHKMSFHIIFTNSRF